MLKRKIDNVLLEWKNRADHKPLIVKGARQIGKTESIRKFGHENYRIVIEINFVLQKKYQAIFDQGYEVDDIIKNISLLDPSLRFEPGRTLFFFDELQACPDCATCLKSFKQDGRYDVICSGSLMGIYYQKIESNSVGYKEDFEMHSLDFEEFLWAIGREPTMDLIREFFGKRKPLGQEVNRRIMEAYRQYLVVGGMPQAVEEFVKSRDLHEVDIAKRAILDLYRQDIWKHAGGLAVKVERIFDEIPDQLSRHEKKFKVSDLEESAKMRDYADSFKWLENAMIVNLAWNSTEPNVGLKLNLNRKSMKCYLADTGLLVSHAFDENALAAAEVHRRILLDRIELNKGMLVENMAAQMLTAAGRRLYFHSESSPDVADNRMEIDFLVSKTKLTARHNVSPIEIKSGDNTTHASLDKYCRKYAEWCAEPFLFYDKDVKSEKGITYLPHYMLPCMG